MEELEVRAAVFGADCALAAAVSALIAAHPDQALLRRALDNQRQASLSHIESSPVPEGALNSFLTTWQLILSATPLARPDGS
jgi:hypothetical protein